MTRHPFRLAVLGAAAALALGAQVAPLPAFAQTTTTSTVTTTTTAVLMPAGTAAPVGASGIDRHGMDPKVRPQDDLYLSMNGEWMRDTPMPADKSRWGTFLELRDRTDAQVRTVVEGLHATNPAHGTNAQKVDDFYRAYLDEAAIDKIGLAAIAPSLQDVDSVQDARALVALMGHWQGVVGLPVRVGIDADSVDPTRYIPTYRQAGLGLPDRDYYLKADDRFAKARAAYVAYVTKLFSLSGDADAAAHANQVMALETKIAQVQLPRGASRDPKKTNNPTTPAQLAALAPGVDWATFATQAQLPAGATVVVAQPTYVAALAGLLQSEPLPAWRLYLKARRIDTDALVLPAGFRDASFAFHGAAIEGLKQPLARWQSAIAQMNGALGEAAGQLYVAQYFPPAYRARMQALVANLLKAYSTSIDGLAWMSPETKAEAHKKLSQYTVKIGYPDKWRDYSALEVRAGDALGNADRGAAFRYHRDAVRVGGKVDRSEWGMTPQTVNAYYSENYNEIVFPAAILQPPFFNANADDAVNYGAIGAVIGHEISHGFDDQGSQYDGEGRLRNWWTADDRKAFDAITARLVAQYDGYSPIPGQHLNGKLTLGENIADLSGLQISYKAWQMSLNGQPAPVIDGLTGPQRFFYGFAQVWRGKQRDEQALQLLTTDPHSPGEFRADGAVVNADAFHDAFGTKPGDGMWKAPADRIRLW